MDKPVQHLQQGNKSGWGDAAFADDLLRRAKAHHSSWRPLTGHRHDPDELHFSQQPRSQTCKRKAPE